MANYTPINNLLTTLLSVNFYTADTVDTIVSDVSAITLSAAKDYADETLSTVNNSISSLSTDIDDMLSVISNDINPKVATIADAVSAHIIEVDAISTIVSGLTGTVDGLTGMAGDVNDLKAINTQLSGVATLAEDGSVSILSVISKVNEILNKFKQS